MTLFPDALLDDLRRIPGATYSFARQVAAPDGATVRARLEAIAAQVGGAVSHRWADVLSSLDNRRFFQGFAEAGVAGLLQDARWQVPDLAWPGPGLHLMTPSGLHLHGAVLAFIRQVRPGADQAAIQRLAGALGRTSAKRRIGLVVNRWLPHDFDPEPVRQAVDMWLREVERGTWTGRYAAYEDEHISLEFSLTGEEASRGQTVLAFTLGPFQAHRVLDAVGSRMVEELDRLRLHSPTPLPVLLSCVTDQPWRLPDGYLRELLYGKPTWQTQSGDPPELLSAFSPGDAPSLYRDPLYRNVAGVLFLERPLHDPAALRGRAFLNPWASDPVAPQDLPVPTFQVVRWEGEMAVMGWAGRG